MSCGARGRMVRSRACLVRTVANRDRRAIGRGDQTRDIEMGQTALAGVERILLAERVWRLFGEPIACGASHTIHRAASRTPSPAVVSGRVPLVLREAWRRDR